MQKSILIAFMSVALIAIYLGMTQTPDSEMTQEVANDTENSISASHEERSLPLTSLNSVPSDSVLPYKSSFGNLPSTLEGTVFKQALAVDEQGHLRVSSDLKRVFDYFLSAIEEEELDIILARINEYLDFQLDEPALGESKQVLSQYIALKQALFDFENARSESLRELIESGELLRNKGMYIELLKEQLQARSDLRAEHLSAEVYESFYADEEAYDQYTLSRIQIESNDDLSAEQKAQALAEIDANAPSDLVASRKESQATDILKERTAELRQSGASQEELNALRTEMFGSEAAERFSALDQERAQWKARVDEYLAERKDILLNEGLSEQERQAQIDDLRSNNFDEREQIRIKVYERRSEV